MKLNSIIRAYAHKLLLVTLLAALPTLTYAQLERSESFNQKYSLKEVVIMSRHNIRSPLCTNGSTLGQLTPHKWIDWSAGTSELTLRGGILETQMGQFFRKWVVNAGLFTENYAPSTDEVNIYANSMQRTIATAEYFSSAFMPVANLNVYHRFSPSKMDPLFFPRLTKVNDVFVATAKKQIAAMGGKKGMEGINEDLLPSYRVMEKALDMNKSEKVQKGEYTHFGDYPTELLFELGKEPNMKGGLKMATKASDAFVLQYYEAENPIRAAFGHNLSFKEWQKISHIKDVYGDVLFAAPIVAVNVAHPLLQYINDELNSEHRKFTFLCGHDSNIASLTSALEVDDYYLPNAIEMKTPIGSKIVFEKWQDKEGNTFVAINLVYQNVDQLQNTRMLDLKNRPEIVPLHLKGLKTNADGLYNFNDVNTRFIKAIRAYDAI